MMACYAQLQAFDSDVHEPGASTCNHQAAAAWQRGRYWAEKKKNRIYNSRWTDPIRGNGVQA